VGCPRVTIAVPVHNGERYLVEALNSIAAQTFTEWEAVIVDDASTDGSGALAAQFADRHPGKVRLVALEENVGVAQARNIAIRSAGGGELVALLDQDDYWRPDYLEHVVGLFVAAAARGRRPGIVACNAWIDSGEGPSGETFAERFWWSDQIDYDAMIERNYILARALFSRAAFDEVGEFDRACLAGDDYDLWLRLLEAGYSVVTTREPVVVYRIHADAQSSDHRFLAEGTIAAYRRALERGAISRSQRRAIHARLRHYRAVREGARLRTALTERRRSDAVVLALRALPLGMLAFLQDPRRWAEWTRATLGVVPSSLRHR
jgi:glycosyltransferase involved in cell wall biosynthesis